MRGDAASLGPGIFKCWYHYPELADSHILLNLLRAGYSICKICEMLECTRTNVASAKKNHGNPAVLRRTRTRRNAKKNEEVKQPRRTKKTRQKSLPAPIFTSPSRYDRAPPSAAPSTPHTKCGSSPEHQTPYPALPQHAPCPATDSPSPHHHRPH